MLMFLSFRGLNDLEEQGDMSMRIGGRRKLFSFAGYRVADAIVAADVAQVNLDVDRRYRLACPDCGLTMGVNRATLHTARDLPVGTPRSVLIRYPARQD